MSQLIDDLISVTGFVLFALAGIVWLTLKPYGRGPRRWLTAVVILYCAGSMRVVPWVLSRPLVYGFHHFSSHDVAPDLTAIVLLGGGGFTVHGPPGPHIGVLDLSSAARVLEAAYVYRLLGSPWIISSGGRPEGVETEPIAAIMRMALVQTGVPADRIVLEASSKTTRDEAVLVAPMLQATGVTRIVLVTSDVHMRRSLAAFRGVGIDAVPAIAEDPWNYESRIRSFIPSTQGLQFTNAVVHEYVGLLYYAARGWMRFSP